jgi:DNA-binding transcriptional MerR regulator
MTSDERPEADLTIGQAAERTGLSVHALRYYEREGLFVAPVRRDRAGRRVYSEWDLEWLEVCTKFRSSGMPLTAIKRYAEMVRAGSGNEADRLALLRAHQEQVRAQLRDLTACLDIISIKVGLYEEFLAAESTRAPATAPQDPLWDMPQPAAAPVTADTMTTA